MGVLRLLRWRKIWALLRRDGRLLWRGLWHPASPWWFRLAIVLMLAYAISPIDLLPDWIPLLGWADDVLLLSWGASCLRQRLPASLRLALEQR
jgi:uncharacterized membrane protein YkvA (DUF1232 family)